MSRPKWTPPTQPQLHAASDFATVIRRALRTPGGVPHEKAILVGAQLGGSFLLRSLDVPLAGLAPGAEVQSEAANERGPLLVQTLGAGLAALKVPIQTGWLRGAREPSEAARIGVTEAQALVERALLESARRHGLTLEQSAHACALAVGQMIQMAAVELDPHRAFELATWGFVQGTRTVPVALDAAG